MSGGAANGIASVVSDDVTMSSGGAFTGRIGSLTLATGSPAAGTSSISAAVGGTASVAVAILTYQRARARMQPAVMSTLMQARALCWKQHLGRVRSGPGGPSGDVSIQSADGGTSVYVLVSSSADCAPVMAKRAEFSPPAMATQCTGGGLALAIASGGDVAVNSCGDIAGAGSSPSALFRALLGRVFWRWFQWAVVAFVGLGAGSYILAMYRTVCRCRGVCQ